MNLTLEKYHSLSIGKQKEVQIFLCELAYKKWLHYLTKNNIKTYVESVCGTKQKIDKNLPFDAIQAVKEKNYTTDISSRYLEPITAMQDLDLEFPNEIEFSYYCVYNLFEFYITKKEIDSCIIINQALSALEKDEILDNLQNAINHISIP